MNIDVVFQENACTFDARFGEVQTASDGGYERGYAAGYEVGNAEGYTKGHAEGNAVGIQTEYDRFWNNYQQNGERTIYTGGFQYDFWNDESFKPKYKVYPIIGNAIFSNCSLTTITEDQLDLSRATTVNRCFSNCTELKNLCPIDVGMAKDCSHIFQNCGKLTSIHIKNISETATITSDTFSCSALVDLVLENCTFASDVSFSSSYLSDASVQQIVDSLKDLSGSTAKTLKLHATVRAKLTEEQLALIAAKNWMVG